MEFKNDYILGFIICEILTVITFQDWVGWGIFTIIPGCPRRANGDSQYLEARPELQDWIRSEFQGAPKGRQQKGETGPGMDIFADFCRFSVISGSLCKSRDLGVVENRRKPQICAGNRRKPQILAETGFSHLLSPFWRAPRIIYRKKLQDRALFEIIRGIISNSTVFHVFLNHVQQTVSGNMPSQLFPDTIKQGDTGRVGGGGRTP